MREERSGNVDALRAVVELMECSPQEVEAMLGAVPAIRDEGDRENAYRIASRTERAQIEEPHVREPDHAPDEWNDRSDDGDHDEEGGPERAPAFDVHVWTRRPSLFDE